MLEFWTPIAYFACAVAVFIVFICLATAEGKKLELKRSQEKAEAIKRLGGEHMYAYIDAELIEEFRLSKGMGVFDEISTVRDVIQGHDVILYFGDFLYGDDWTTTAFLTVVDGVEFEPFLTHPTRWWFGRELFVEVTPLEEVFDSRIRELIERRKWKVETCDSSCLIYPRFGRHEPNEYADILEDVKRIVAELLPPNGELES